MMAWLFALRAAQAATLDVCPTCEHSSIAAAVSAAEPGAVLRVRAGTYPESGVEIDKPLRLVAEGPVIVDAGGQGHVFVVRKADAVAIEGFTLRNTGMSFTEEFAAVRVIEGKDCRIAGNAILDATYGVYLEKSEGCEVSGNRIEGAARDEVSGGNGIHVWNGGAHLIRGNRISGHRDGIYLEFAARTRILENTVTGNIRYGLHFMSSSETSYLRNRFRENGAGVAVMYSRTITMEGNEFSGNTGPAAYGLLLKEVHDSEILGNSFDRNTVGIFMEGSNRSRFAKNRVRGNGWALRIMGDCESNSFTGNDFLANSFDVATNSDHSWNRFERNYWSRYRGYDRNHDGLGDIPYRAVSFSSLVMERVDSSYILMNSFLLDLVDQVERALPSLIPEAIKDGEPLMSRANPEAAGDD